MTPIFGLAIGCSRHLCYSFSLFSLSQMPQHQQMFSPLHMIPAFEIFDSRLPL
jgi:hypothetical protein